MDSIPRVLICEPFHADGIALLRSVAEVDVALDLSSQELLLRIVDYAGIVVGSQTPVNKKLLKQAIQLKVIAHAGSRLGNIDFRAIKKYDIELLHNPGAHTIAVAEHTMAFLLAMARRLPTANQQTQQGVLATEGVWGMGLAGKTLGIIGYGRIGRQVTKRAIAFDMNVLVNQIERTDELALDEQEGIIQLVDLNDLLAEADFVSLHVPLNKTTRHLIGAEQLKRMKRSAILINTARGRGVG